MSFTEKNRYELFSSHSGRRSFITISYELGVPLNVIQLATGHKKLENLMGYITKNNNTSINIASMMDAKMNNL